ncbi:l-asparaginase protein [Colletotrichum incanum]|uniref:asparaginase n=1 Tax=Colletotrichum incanum TaxID=1573173 RepID=A0A167C8F5_COLIC|nr:l-asparaginase protein [Colletotrichum incanum]
MLLRLLTAALALATGTIASPVARSNETKKDWDLDWMSTDPSLPKVMQVPWHIYSTGGTILSASNYSRLDNIAYGSGDNPTPEDLISNIPEVLSVAQLAIIQFPTTEGGSAGVNSSLYLNISQHANRQLCAEGSDVAGAVMFHGTDTLEETVSGGFGAFGVDLTFNCSKPFVATGAMRPDTYISPDGYANIYQAVAAAASPSSRDRGGLIAFNDRITSVYYSTKLNANTPDTFKSLEQGNLGAFLAGQPYYFFGAAYPTGRPHFDVTTTTELPSVAVLYCHQGFDASLMYAAVDSGAKGLVILGPGAASLSPSAAAAAADLFEKGVPTIAAPRPATGAGIPHPATGSLIYSGYLGGEQARIMLQLAINAGYDLEQIRDLFERHLRNAVYDPAANQKFYYP